MRNTQLQEQSKGPDFPRQLMWHYFTLKTEVGSLRLLPIRVKQIKPRHYMSIGWYYHLKDSLASTNLFHTAFILTIWKFDYWVIQSLGFWSKRVQLSESSQRSLTHSKSIRVLPCALTLAMFSVLTTSLLTSTAAAISQAMMWLLA